MRINKLLSVVLTVIFLASSVTTFAIERGESPENEPWYRIVERSRFEVNEQTKDNDISVILNSNKVEFINKPFIQNREIMLPAKEMFEKMGFFIGWVDKSHVVEYSGGFLGKVNGADAFIIPNQNVAYYDDVPLELYTATVAAENEVYVPLYYFQFVYDLSVKTNDATVYFELKKRVVDTQEETVEEIDIEKVVEGIDGDYFISWEKMLENAERTEGDVTSKAVKLENDKFTDAIEIENKSRPAAYYYNQVSFPGEMPATIGDVCVLTGWVRYTYCVDESGFAKTRFCVETSGDWLKAYIGDEILVGAQWQRFVAAFSMPFNRKDVSFKIRVGYNYQTLQFADVNIVNYGKKIKLSDLIPEEEVEILTSYRGEEDNALWREEAFRRIEKYRKSPIKVSVKDENGNPVQGADVRLTMTRNEFIFASELGSHTWRNTSNRYVYFDGYKNWLNGFVWGNEFKAPATVSAMSNAAFSANFARENNLYIRGHAIIYDYPLKDENYTDEEIQAMSYDDIYRLYMEQSSLKVTLLDDFIKEYDIYNEPPDYRDARNKFGWIFITDVLESVGELIGEDKKTYINLTGYAGQPGGIEIDAYKKNKGIMEEIDALGIEYTGIGHQAHGGGNVNPVDYYLQIDALSRNAEALGTTEYDYLPGATMGTTAEEKEKIAADHLRDMLIATYSHPKATGFTMWGYTDYYHWKNIGPLADATFHPKEKALNMWLSLVGNAWLPDEKGVTDENGEYYINTHRGEFDVTVSVDGKSAKTTLKSTKNGENHISAVVVEDGIMLESSEEVVTLAEITEPINLLKAKINNRNMKNAYLWLKDNMLNTAVSENGSDVSFLLNNENVSPWVSKNGDKYVVFGLKEERERGYITLKWYGDEKYAYQVEISEDGESWTKLAGTESEERNIHKFSDTKVKYIRLSGIFDKVIAPCSVAVYPVEYFARNN